MTSPISTSTPQRPLVRPGGGPSNRAAFSLIEVLCAILILGVALAGLTSGLTTALRSARESHLQTAAALFAAGRIETLRAEGYLVDESTDGDCLEAVPNCRWRQSVAATDLDGLHDVTVTIETPAPDSRVVYELRTLLFETPTLASTTGSRDSRSPNARSRANGNANSLAP